MFAKLQLKLIEHAILGDLGQDEPKEIVFHEHYDYATYILLPGRIRWLPPYSFEAETDKGCQTCSIVIRFHQKVLTIESFMPSFSWPEYGAFSNAIVSQVIS